MTVQTSIFSLQILLLLYMPMLLLNTYTEPGMNKRLKRFTGCLSRTAWHCLPAYLIFVLLQRRIFRRKRALFQDNLIFSKSTDIPTVIPNNIRIGGCSSFTNPFLTGKVWKNYCKLQDLSSFASFPAVTGMKNS